MTHRLRFVATRSTSSAGATSAPSSAHSLGSDCQLDPVANAGRGWHGQVVDDNGPGRVDAHVDLVVKGANESLMIAGLADLELATLTLGPEGKLQLDQGTCG